MIRILIAEDMHILREALVELLSLEDDLTVVAGVASGLEIVSAALEHRPDVAVIDIDLPGLDGISAAAELRRRLPGCRVLILTALAKPGVLRRALGAQIAGFVRKDIRPAELAAAIRTVAAGGRVVDPALALVALEAPESPLSQRETEVLRLSASGAQPAEIAERLFLTYGTIRNYLTSAVTKLGARNRVDAIRIATESGWI
ncbi:response regulator transcription factor [Nonomuraea aurantiaca]|uniref:response regulator transcription factor n=1 Tax=Nonomuraea aurantiaca TaxID=2878562 RepID=UPI001CD9EF2E|nr:response regulator transcription factor [Nonomuraea aurantiaca]MCA2223833.1 response regulator transcription factor [Nonomuraea aurantiaca]